MWMFISVYFFGDHPDSWPLASCGILSGYSPSKSYSFDVITAMIVNSVFVSFVLNRPLVFDIRACVSAAIVTQVFVDP